MSSAIKYIGIAIAGIIVGLLLSTVNSSVPTGGVYSQVQQDFRQGGIITDCIEMTLNGTSYTIELQSTASTTGATGDRLVPSYKAGTCN